MEKRFKNEVVFDFQSYHTPLTRSVYVGVFLGFITAIVCLAYWSIAVNVLQLTMSSYIVNVQTIAFGGILPVVICSLLYATLSYYLKSAGGILALVLYAIGIIWLIIVIYKGNYGDTPRHIQQFKELIIPIIAIIGLVGAVVFPICVRSKKVEDAVL